VSTDDAREGITAFIENGRRFLPADKDLNMITDYRGYMSTKDPRRNDKVIIATCSGYFGDRLAAAKEMVQGGPHRYSDRRLNWAGTSRWRSSSA